LQVVWFDLGPKQLGRLLLVIHHFAVDGVSWRILVPDLQTAWDSTKQGQVPKLGQKGTSFRSWTTLLQKYANDETRSKEVPFWAEMLRAPTSLIFDPSPDLQGDTVGNAGHFSLTVPSDITDPLLTAVPTAFHGGVNDVLLTALALTITRWVGERRSAESRALLLDLESHGRDEIFSGIDLSRTVGWFTSLFPVRLDLGGIEMDDAWRGGVALGVAVKKIKEQLRRIPNGGLGYGLLRYLNSETGSMLASLRKPQIGFNYLGRFRSSPLTPWSLAQKERALSGGRDPGTRLAHCLEINVVALDYAEGPQLRARWSWAPTVLAEEDIKKLAEGWSHLLKMLVTYVTQPNVGGRTPSDIPLVSLTQGEIDGLEQRIRARTNQSVS
jgi:non-ribosomal peptide synthase protein (TIGR01720 family)